MGAVHGRDERRGGPGGLGSVAVGLVLLALALGSGATAGTTDSGPTGAAPAPNIVFVLTDDLAWNLVTQRYMPHVLKLERDGETFDHYVVADSLCCPSRSSIFTGMFPHDTGVFRNKGKDGGYFAFTHHKPSLENLTYAVAMQPYGYLTSMMGKYLNGYGEPTMTTTVPPGWSDWNVAGNGYGEFDYDLNSNGKVVHYGGSTGSCGSPGTPDNYGVDVLAGKATAFIDRAAKVGKPFVMEVGTFAPHSPYVPAPIDACDFPGLKEPRDPSFDTNNTNPPAWLGTRAKLTSTEVSTIDTDFRMRAQAVESVDRLIADVESTLAARGLSNDTYIVFSSDNGYHMGQHRLLPGKQTAFDTDIRVPLIVDGPGVPRDQVVTKMVQNIDLYPTFVQLAGLKPRAKIDGSSLVELLHPPGGITKVTWPTVALIEHHGPGTSAAGDPDFENGAKGGNPPSYEAIRIDDAEFGNAVYVEYTTTGEREYYDIDKDRFEQDNIYSTLTMAQQNRLHTLLVGLEDCHDAAACWTAGEPKP